MRERPILFNAEMVAAILAGRKSQTRRIIRGQPPADWEPHYNPETQAWECPDERATNWIFPRKCPFGVPGDRLWVREAWRLWEGETWGVDGALDPDVLTGQLSRYDQGWLRGRPVEYRSDTDAEGPWRPSIHMPRWCSRIDLEVVSVHPERLQAISDNDARAEGVKRYGGMYVDTSRHILPFSQLWDSIYAKPRPVYRRVDGKRVIDHYESHPWKDIQAWRMYRFKHWQVIGNPWVWACEFKEISGGKQNL